MYLIMDMGNYDQNISSLYITEDNFYVLHQWKLKMGHSKPKAIENMVYVTNVWFLLNLPHHGYV
jgi:hypothetical protein